MHSLPLVTLILQVIKEHNDVSFVIDGLDECQSRMELFPHLQQLSNFARVFVTSRDEDDIRDNLQQHCKHELAMTTGRIRGEIKNFVQTTIDNHIQAHPSFVRNRSTANAIVRRVVAEANGM